jgi:hypothetical protein
MRINSGNYQINYVLFFVPKIGIKRGLKGDVLHTLR